MVVILSGDVASRRETVSQWKDSYELVGRERAIGLSKD